MRRRSSSTARRSSCPQRTPRTAQRSSSPQRARRPAIRAVSRRARCRRRRRARSEKTPVVTLALERVSVARGGRTLLSDVSLTLDGGVVALVGPNGVGKTTLLRAMAGVLAPASGTIALDGVAVRTLPARERARQIALVDPTEPVLAALTVTDAVG